MVNGIGMGGGVTPMDDDSDESEPMAGREWMKEKMDEWMKEKIKNLRKIIL